MKSREDTLSRVEHSIARLPCFGHIECQEDKRKKPKAICGLKSGGRCCKAALLIDMRLMVCVPTAPDNRVGFVKEICRPQALYVTVTKSSIPPCVVSLLHGADFSVSPPSSPRHAIFHGIKVARGGVLKYVPKFGEAI